MLPEASDSSGFNRAYTQVFGTGHLTLGLMTPLVRETDRPSDFDRELCLATRAGGLGFAALWTRDVPLLIPQGTPKAAAILDDPFVWLAALALAAPSCAVGTAAAVLPLRHPLHLAKSAWSLDRLSGGRFILGLGSGDRPEELAAFGIGDTPESLFREHWRVLADSLAPHVGTPRDGLPAPATFDPAPIAQPDWKIPMLAVGTARQSLQWIAANADGWATYHRDEVRQQGRIALWSRALDERAQGIRKPFVQSLQLELLAEPAAPAQALELGLRAGRDALLGYLERMAGLGVAHMIVQLQGPRPIEDQLEELGAHVIPRLHAMLACGGKHE
jgi:luciferase-type oxidoreductase